MVLREILGRVSFLFLDLVKQPTEWMNLAGPGRRGKARRGVAWPGKAWRGQAGLGRVSGQTSSNEATEETMQNASVKRDELIKRLEENRVKHRETFEKAMDVYQEKITELLENLIDRARRGKIIPHHALYDLPMPEDHTNDYDLAIEMLSMDTRDELLVTAQDFRRYVMDLWEWSESFTSNTVAYAAGAIR